MAVCAGLVPPGLVRGQAPAAPTDPIKFTLADGRALSALAVRRSKDTLLATVTLAAGVRGDVAYPLASIKKIEMPEPAALKSARSLLAAGKFAEALAQINVVTTAQGDLRQIPGNWWAAAALVKVDALLALKRDREAEALINELAANTKDAQLLQNARMALAEMWLRNGRSSEAIAVFDATIEASKNTPALARAWRDKGEALLSIRDYDGALVAYLRVPIFYPNEKAALPAALLGSARAYEGLGDVERAKTTLAELTEKFPASPEADSAKADSARIDKKLNPSPEESTPPSGP